MSEGYKPTAEDYKKAEAMLTDEMASRSSHRASRSQNIESKADLADSDLKLEETEDGKIVVVSGKFKGHDVVVKRFLGEGERETYTAQVDGAEELTGKVAQTLFDRYYQLARIENI